MLQMSAIMMMMFLLMMTSVMNSEKASSKMIFSMIIMTMVISIMISNLSKNSWASFSLYLIMVGGLMILFTLMTSITPKMMTSSLYFSNMMIIPMTVMVSFENSMNNKMSPNMTMLNKLYITLIIIIMLNLSLLMISKLLTMPMKPFRSTY